VSHAELPPSARTPITRTPWARRLHDKQEPAINFRTCSRSSRRAERPICRASSSLGLLLSERRERRAECRWMKSWERATCSSRPRDGTAVRCDAYSRALKRVGPWGDVVVEETRKRTRRTGVQYSALSEGGAYPRYPGLTLTVFSRYSESSDARQRPDTGNHWKHRCHVAQRKSAASSSSTEWR
jgi:hypothetical protein